MTIEHLRFRLDTWLMQNTLSEDNVLDYFYQSPFYDTNSLNQRARRGEQISNIPDSILYQPVYASNDGKGLTEAPDYIGNIPNDFGIFIIVKFRNYKDIQRPEQAYYVIAGTIYQAPAFAKFLRHRLGLTADHLHSTFQAVRSMVRMDLACRDGTAVWTTGGPEADVRTDPLSVSTSSFSQHQHSNAAVANQPTAEKIAVSFAEKRTVALEKALKAEWELLMASTHRFDNNHKAFVDRYLNGIGEAREVEGALADGEGNGTLTGEELKSRQAALAKSFSSILKDDENEYELLF